MYTRQMENFLTIINREIRRWRIAASRLATRLKRGRKTGYREGERGKENNSFAFETDVAFPRGPVRNEGLSKVITE